MLSTNNQSASRASESGKAAAFCYVATNKKICDGLCTGIKKPLQDLGPIQPQESCTPVICDTAKVGKKTLTNKKKS